MPSLIPGSMLASCIGAQFDWWRRRRSRQQQQLAILFSAATGSTYTHTDRLCLCWLPITIAIPSTLPLECVLFFPALVFSLSDLGDSSSSLLQKSIVDGTWDTQILQILNSHNWRQCDIEKEETFSLSDLSKLRLSVTKVHSWCNLRDPDSELRQLMTVVTLRQKKKNWTRILVVRF